MLDKDRERNEGYLDPIDLPDEHVPTQDGNDGNGQDGESVGDDGQSLTDDIIDLIDDGRTYLESEIAFQKSRGAYVAERARGLVAFGLGAFGVLHLALIAATVGLVIALVPLIGAWGATAVVTGALVLLGVILVNLARKRIRQIAAAFAEKDS